MKVRKLIAFMNSYTKGMSGGDACFIEIAKRIPSFEKVVITSRLGEEACRARQLKAQFLITTREKVFRRVILSYTRRIIQVFRLKINVEGYDILYATSDFLPDVLPALYHRFKNRRRGVRWVQRIFHIISSRRWIPHYAQKASLFLIRRFADLVVVDNFALKNDLVRRGFDPLKMEVNYPGIDVNYFEKLTEGGLKSYEAVFLGRLHPSKGIFDLVDIWKGVCAHRPGSRLAMIGEVEPVVEKELKRRVAEAGLMDRVHLLGYLEADAAFKLIKASRVFVFASYEEGFGIAILEAMACGLPVVAWDLPVYREVFPKGMMRIPIGNKLEFSGAILRVLQNGPVGEDMPGEAKEVVSRYDWERIARQEEALIESVGRGHVQD